MWSRDEQRTRLLRGAALALGVVVCAGVIEVWRSLGVSGGHVVWRHAFGAIYFEPDATWPASMVTMPGGAIWVIIPIWCLLAAAVLPTAWWAWRRRRG